MNALSSLAPAQSVRRAAATAPPRHATTSAKRAGVLALLALGTSALALPVNAELSVTATPLALESAAAPDGNGVFGAYNRFNEPCLNDSGQVGFSARLNGTAGGTLDDTIIVRADPGGTINLLAREGQAIPDGPGAFGVLNTVTRAYSMNDSGRVAFTAGLTGTPGGASDNSGIYSIKDPGHFWVHARSDWPAPDPFGGTPLGNFFAPQINDQPPAAISFYNTGWSFVSRLGLLSLVCYSGQPAPDALDPEPQPIPDGMNGSIFNFPSGDPPALRPNAAEVAVWAHLMWTHDAARDDDGIFRASADELSDMARGNHPAPGGGTYGEFTSPVYNANGVAAFTSALYPVGPTGSIVALDWPFGGDLVAYSGQPAADGNGIFSQFGPPALNDDEAVAFRVVLAGTVGGGSDDTAIYKGDSLLIVVPPLEDQLAREGQPPPEGNGVFNNFNAIVAINNAGQVLFIATLRETSGGASDDRGLYLWDSVNGITKLLREGDVIGGRTVAEFSTLTARDFGGFRCLNDAGCAVARVDMSGIGGDGVYLFCTSSIVGVEPAGAPSAALVAGPNPFGAVPLALRFTLPSSGGNMSVAAYDVSGRRVRVLFEGPADSNGTLRWDGTDAEGRPLPAGIYFVRLESPRLVAVRRVVCVR